MIFSRLSIYTLVALGALLMSLSARAEQLILPPLGTDLVGSLREVVAQQNESLSDIARRFDLGHNEIDHANPNVDHWLPKAGTEVLLPTRYILPAAPRRGLVLNLPEMRVYYYPKSSASDETAKLITYPVSIGRMDWKTPMGFTRIVKKVKDPAWYPPASIKKEALEKGEPLPDVVPAGPDNPLGQHSLRLSMSGYLMHGTNKPYGVGMRVSHGCLRFYPEDIAELFDLVSVNTRVNIINQPVKAGWFMGMLYLEVHPPLDEDEHIEQTLRHAAMEAINQARLGYEDLGLVSGRAVKRAVTERRGIPVPILKQPL
ncbi:MAG: L,D-transpeptidase family protein [Gammaproteobacteria bacterium]|nr:L,D-transpeptidase family protein [Gammaproteobacteria bacterium]